MGTGVRCKEVGIALAWERNRLACPKDAVDELLLERRLIQEHQRKGAKSLQRRNGVRPPRTPGSHGPPINLKIGGTHDSQDGGLERGRELLPGGENLGQAPRKCAAFCAACFRNSQISARNRKYSHPFRPTTSAKDPLNDYPHRPITHCPVRITPEFSG